MGDPARLHNKSPDNADLARLFSGVANNYFLIGTMLGVGTGELQGLQQSPMGDRVKLAQVFQKWMDAYRDVTWGRIVKLCEDIGDNETKDAVLGFLGEKATQDKYLATPDFVGI